MLVSNVKLNIIQQSGSSNNNTQKMSSGDTSNNSGGGFMSVLSMMMKQGNNQSADMMKTLKSQNISLDSIKDFFQNADTNFYESSLMLGLMQNLLSDTQNFQQLMQDLLKTNESNLQQIALLNYGQIKDELQSYSKDKFAELIQSLQLRINGMSHVTTDEVRRIIGEELRNLFKKEGLLDESALLKPYKTDIEQQPIATSNSDMEASELFTSLIIAKFQRDGKITGEAYQDMSKRVLDTDKSKYFVGNTEGFRLNLKDILGGQNAETPLKNDAFNLLFASDKNVNSESLFNTIIEELGVQDMEVTGDSANTNFKNQHIGFTESSNHQSAQIKNEQALRETIHVSRLQDIDTKIMRAVQNDSKTLTIRLEPPELGSINIKLIMTDSGLRADLKVDNPTIRDMMNLALPQIKNTLENEGIRVSEFFVDIREEYYSDGKKQDNDKDNNGNKQQDKDQKDKEFKPFEYYI